MKRRLVAGLAAGALGGALAGFVKMGVEVVWPPRPPERPAEPLVLIQKLAHSDPPDWAAYPIHFAFSILSGAAYGGLVAFVPALGFGAGAAFGLAVWIGAHEIAMPLAKLTPPAAELPANEHAAEAVGHALWGIALELVRDGVLARSA